jgi:hypothetical protein
VFIPLSLYFLIKTEEIGAKCRTHVILEKITVWKCRQWFLQEVTALIVIISEELGPYYKYFKTLAGTRNPKVHADQPLDLLVGRIHVLRGV